MRIAIMGAMDEEIALIKKEMEIESVVTRARMDFIQGRFENQEVVLVRSGIGKVNAAVCTQILIDEFQIGALIFTGVAGAVNEFLTIGDIVISQDAVQHDVDATAFGYELGHVPRMEEKIFIADRDLVALALKSSEDLKFEGRHPKVMVGTVLSGDQFVACPEKVQKLREHFQGHCTEMEGAAVAHVCTLNSVPFVVIRSMSDKADGSAHMNFQEFVEQAAHNSYQMVKNMMKNYS